MSLMSVSPCEDDHRGRSGQNKHQTQVQALVTGGNGCTH